MSNHITCFINFVEFASSVTPLNYATPTCLSAGIIPLFQKYSIYFNALTNSKITSCLISNSR